MDFDELVRTRRTHKAYDPAPVEREVLDELFDLARWAPNHHLTNPWRFRVVGPAALEALKEAAGPENARKLDRAPTLVAVSVTQSGEDPIADEEDLAAGAGAALIVLLGAHARGLGGYWRTPGVLRTPQGRAACGIPDGEKVLGLLHLGRAKGEKVAPERAPLDAIRTYLD
jgi:nitroreductase